jgi:hypothetical protein
MFRCQSFEGVSYIEIVMNVAPRNHVIQQIDGHQCEVGDCDAVFGGGLMHFRTSGVSSPQTWRCLAPPFSFTSAALPPVLLSVPALAAPQPCAPVRARRLHRGTELMHMMRKGQMTATGRLRPAQ